jgi:hypothetical protein
MIGIAAALPAACDQPGALATRVCVAMPAGAMTLERPQARSRPAPSRRAAAEDEHVDPATEALNSREMQWLRLRNSR